MSGEPAPHEPNLRELCAEVRALKTDLAGFKELMNERDKRYTERDTANKESVRKAFEASEKAGEKTEGALKEYKIGANEWRDTVQDLIAGTSGKRAQLQYIIGIVAMLVGAAFGAGIQRLFR